MLSASLLDRLRARAASSALTDLHAPPVLPAPASASALDGVERTWGFSLFPDHKTLLVEIADGGFGPGGGLLGTATEPTLSEIHSLSELVGFGVMPICDWGCAIWSCIDTLSGDGRILTLTETEIVETSNSLVEWLTAWLEGAQLWTVMFDFEERTVTNPFTREPMTIRAPAHARGRPFVRRPAPATR